MRIASYAGLDPLDDLVFIKERRLLDSVIADPAHDDLLGPLIGVAAVEAYPDKVGPCRFEAILTDVNLESRPDFKVKGRVFPLTDIAQQNPLS